MNRGNLVGGANPDDLAALFPDDDSSDDAQEQTVVIHGRRPPDGAKQPAAARPVQAAMALADRFPSSLREEDEVVVQAGGATGKSNGNVSGAGVAGSTKIVNRSSRTSAAPENVVVGKGVVRESSGKLSTSSTRRGKKDSNRKSGQVGVRAQVNATPSPIHTDMGLVPSRNVADDIETARPPSPSPSPSYAMSDAASEFEVRWTSRINIPTDGSASALLLFVFCFAGGCFCVQSVSLVFVSLGVIHGRGEECLLVNGVLLLVVVR